MPKVVITMPAYRAELTLEKTVADIPRDVAVLLLDSLGRDAVDELRHVRRLPRDGPGRRRGDVRDVFEPCSSTGPADRAIQVARLHRGGPLDGAGPRRIPDGGVGGVGRARFPTVVDARLSLPPAARRVARTPGRLELGLAVTRRAALESGRIQD